MASQGNGVVSIGWYSTVFRSEQFAVAVAEIAPVAARYGATDYRVYRNRDDIYKFLQMATFERYSDWERYWYGQEFTDWRASYASWFQVPVVPAWNDLIISGGVDEETAELPDIEPGVANPRV